MNDSDSVVLSDIPLLSKEGWPSDQNSRTRGRGGSMKGAVKRNTSATTGRTEETDILRTASPTSVKTICEIPVWHRFETFIITSMIFRTEKRLGGDVVPTMVLFESQWTTAFPGRARGDRVFIGSSAIAVDQSPRGSSPPTLPFRTAPTTSESNRSRCRQTVGTAMSSSSVS